MDFLSIDNVMRQAKSMIINPQVATYAGIGITTTLLASYTLFENDASSKSEEPVEKKEEPVEEKEEPEPVKEPEPVEEKEEPVEEKEEELAAPLTGGNRKKKSRMNKKKEKKNKSKRKQSK